MVFQKDVEFIGEEMFYFFINFRIYQIQSMKDNWENERVEEN